MVGRWPQDGRPSWTRRDPAEEVALVAEARRELLLRAHGHRLGREDLEDCYGQATLELIVQARNHGALSSRAHTANVLEQRFLSRVFDRRRALTGRSPMQAALHTAISLSGGAEGEIEIVDERADVERLAMLRFELALLERVAPALSSDQRLVLACQVGLQITIAGLRLDTSHNGTDVGPNREENGPRWRILDHVPTWARWSVRHPPGL